MAVTTTNVSTPSNQFVFQDTAASNAVDSVKSSSAVVYSIKADNSANVSAPAYVKLYNLASGSVSVGVTAPDFILYVPGGSVVTLDLFTGANAGILFNSALSLICVTTGGTAGNTAPAANVIASVIYV